MMKINPSKLLGVINRRLILVWTLVYTILFILLNKIYTLRFSTNDDSAMLLISSGSYTGTPDNHLVFINFIYGSILNVLYNVMPSIEWYTILFIALNIFSLASLTTIICKLSYNIIHRVFLVVLMISIFVYGSTVLQFTLTAAITATAGLSLIYMRQYRFIGFFLVIVASLIRFEAAILIFLMASSLFLDQSISIKALLKKKQTKFLLVLFIALCCLEGLDYLYYHSDSKWKAYSKYNSIRGKINDNPNLSKFVNKDLRTSVKEITTQQDFFLLAFYFFPDPTILTYEKLVKIEAILNNYQVSSKLNNITFIKEHKILNILLIFYAIIFIYFNKQRRLNIVLLVVVFFGVLSVLSFDNIVKDRVYYPAFLMVLLALIFINSNKNLEKVVVFLFLPLLFLSILTLQKSNRLLKQNEDLRGNFDKQQLQLNKYLLNKQKKLIPFPNTYKAYFNIFEISNKFPKERILFCGWMSAIPFNENKFESFKDLVDGNFGLLVEDAYAETYLNLIINSIQLNHNIRVVLRIADKDERYSIIEFNRRKN